MVVNGVLEFLLCKRRVLVILSQISFAGVSRILVLALLPLAASLEAGVLEVLRPTVDPSSCSAP